jgi:ankyrin repeat protein
MHSLRPNKLCIASFSLLISFFLQNCNLPANNLPSILRASKHTQPSYLPTTSFNSPPEEEAIVIAPSLPILPMAQVFMASSGEQISFLEEAGIWKAKVVAAYLDLGLYKTLPVICEHQGDILAMLNRLAKQRPTIHKHRIHILPTPSQSQCVFLGSVGLLGGRKSVVGYDSSALHEAVRAEDLELVESLLASGADPNSLDQDGFAPLENATWKGCLALVNLLLKNGADPNQLTSLNASYLHIAAMKHDVELAKVLIENGADINATTTICNIGYTPLDLAVHLDYVAVVQLLLENGANPSMAKDGLETLHWAAERGHLDILHLLLESEPGFNINIMNYHGFTLLNLAAKQGHVAVASLLLDKGADPNIATKDGVTPLHMAADNGHLELVRLLLDKGANLHNFTNQEGFTPLHLAVDQSYISITKLLLEKGADPNKAIQNGATPLHWAAYDGHLELVHLLLEKGADPNTLDHEDCTPLHIAAYRGNLAIVLRLLLCGLDVNAQDDDGDTFLHALLGDATVSPEERVHRFLAVLQSIESTQQGSLNKLLAIIEDCCPELTNNDTKRILAMMVDYVEGLDLSLKNQEDNTVLDILQGKSVEAKQVQIPEKVFTTLQRHQKLGGWLTLPRQKRAFSAISNEDDAMHRSAFKKPKYQ